MASPNFIFSRGRMYDTQDRLIATRDSTGQYIDKRGNVRASERNFLSERNPEPEPGPHVFTDYGREAGQLGSSAPGRRAPSHVKERSISGSVPYPDGVPYDKSAIRPQSASGYAATPTLPKGDGYQQCQQPYRENSVIEVQYKSYKAADTDYAKSRVVYKQEFEKAADESDPRSLVGHGMRGRRLDQKGHRTMMDFAAAENLAGLKGATLRVQHTSDHFGRLPKDKHHGHLEKAAALAGCADNRKPAQRDRYHTHFAQEPSRHESDDDAPSSSRTPSQRQMRTRRHEIEWTRKKGDCELSKQEWARLEKERSDNKARDREHYNAGKGMNRGPLLENGRYEWVAVGGGRRGYWSDYHHSYVPKEENVLDQLRRR